MTLTCTRTCARRRCACTASPTRDDRAGVPRLLGVSGVGPKLALAILSDLTAGELARRSRARQEAPHGDRGVGKKMVERLVLELKDKLPALPPERQPSRAVRRRRRTAARRRSGLRALVGLGFTRAQAEAAVAKVVADDDARPIEKLMRQALATLA